MKQRVRDRLHVTLARLGGPGPDCGPCGIGWGEQRAEEGEARHLPGLHRGKVRRDDGTHGMGDDVRALDPCSLHDQECPLNE